MERIRGGAKRVLRGSSDGDLERAASGAAPGGGGVGGADSSADGAEPGAVTAAERAEHIKVGRIPSLSHLPKTLVASTALPPRAL